MPKFSQDSFSKLSTCHPDLQVLFYEVIKYYDCTILEGYRNQVDQDKYGNYILDSLVVFDADGALGARRKRKNDAARD